MEPGQPYVVCRVTITSPAPDPRFSVPPNLPCGEKVAITQLADHMLCRCPLGHSFFAVRDDIREDA